MRATRDPDAPAPDLGDGLTATHVLPNRDECRLGVSVVDVPSGVGPAVKQQDRGVGAEAADPLADDRARIDGDLDGVAAAGLADRADVDALIEGPGRWRQHDRHRPQREHPPAGAARSGPGRATTGRDMLALVDPPSQRHRGDDTDDPADRVQSRRGLERRCSLLGVRTEDAVRCRPDPDRGQPLLQRLHVPPAVPLAQDPTERRRRVANPAVLTDPGLECCCGLVADNAGDRMQAGRGLKPCGRLPRVRPEHAIGSRPRADRGQPSLQRLHVAPMVALTKDPPERRPRGCRRRQDQPRSRDAAQDDRDGDEQQHGAQPVCPGAPCASSIGE